MVYLHNQILRFAHRICDHINTPYIPKRCKGCLRQQPNFLFIIFGVRGCVFVVLLGSFPDRFGVKVCLIVGNLLHICEFGLLIFVKDLYIQIIIVLALGALPGSLLAPALDSRIKHYSGKHFRMLAVSCYSTISVTASLLGGVLIEIMFSVGSKDKSTFTVLLYLASVVQSLH